jgi:hypothetical protein
MPAIFRYVPAIVDDVHTAGKAAKSKKAGDQFPHPGGTEKLTRKKRWNKQEKILCPVFGPE